MLRKLAISTGCLVGALAAMPAMAAGDATAGLAALKDFNVITLGDFATTSHVEGKVVVGGNLSGANNPVLGNLVSSGTVLSVYGNNNVSQINLGGTRNLFIGGNSGGFNFNGAGAFDVIIGGEWSGTNNLGTVNGQIQVGSNMEANGSVGAGSTVTVGGSVFGGFSAGAGTLSTGGGSPFIDPAVAAGRANIVQIGEDVSALSDALAAFTLGVNPSSSSIVSNVLNLNAVKAGNAFSLFNLTASTVNSANDILYNFALSGGGPVIINVTLDTTLTFDGNFNGGNDSNGQQVIWNIIGNGTVNLTGSQFYGSILAPDAAVGLLGNNINGTVVANSLTQNGEIHLRPLTSNLNVSPVPEPASWALMIGGFALIGGTMRRKATGASVRFA